MKRFLSLALACVLLAGCASGAASSGSGEDGPAPVRYVLSEPVYPEFPQQPEYPVEGSSEDWDAYNEAYDKYMDALHAIQEEGYSLTEAERSSVHTFAAKSTALALAGHEGENVVYSPLSLWSALAMLAQCAEGNSRQQVLDVLGTDHVEELQEMASHIWRTLYTDDGQSALILGNSIWLNSAMEGTYVRETLDTLAQKYYAGTYSVPMGTAAADHAVADWVSRQTNDLIGGEDPVVRTEAETLALLVSSLYYKAAWASEFKAELTEEDVFTDAAGEEVRVDFMHKTQYADFLRQEGWQAARLETRLGEMVFILPDEAIAPESLLQEEDFLARLEFYGDAATWGEVQWSMPKFDVNSDLDLMDALKRLGITDLPDFNKADLSPLTDLDAFLSEAKQLARVKVNEEGVEGAAFTMLMINYGGVRPKPAEVCVMDLDRPFLFIIRTEGMPLFVGIVNQV